jgi:phosphoribosylanthranilate isomerase
MTKVKICGITNLDDARIAVDAGADALGFNFYKKSPRYISAAAAAEIIDRLGSEVLKVGVFVNESVDNIVMKLNIAHLDTIQLHGDESPSFVDVLRKSIDRELIKAFRVSDIFEPADTLDYSVEGILLDGFSGAERGGTGEVFDWEVAKSVWALVGELWLAGGLTPENVREAIREVTPYAVDVCSGVELTKGVKDPEKIKAFIRNAKHAL